jgi:hypothetical protein
MEEKREIAEFNDAFGFLKQLSRDFDICSLSSQGNNPYAWSKALFTLSRALSPWMREAEEQYFITQRDIINNQIFILTRNKKSSMLNQIPPELYNMLDKYERLLWRIYFDSGLMMKKQDDATKSLR